MTPLPRQPVATADAPALTWRVVCQTAAAQAADAESRAVWQTEPDQPIPFRHRWEHVQQVVALAVWLARETGADLTVVEAAAWLHDICKAEPHHAERGAIAAAGLLQETDFPPDKIDQVAAAIHLHEGLTRGDPTPLTPLEAAVLWDADKLAKIGVQSLIYVMSAHYVQGQPLAERRRRNLEFLESVLARTVQNMNTAPAKRLAAQRYRQNLDAMDAWRQDEQFWHDYCLFVGENQP